MASDDQRLRKAIVIAAPGKAEVAFAKYPSCPPDCLIVQTKAVALNPTDWKHIDYIAVKGAVAGCDYSGIVVEIGQDVATEWTIGDRVASFAHGCKYPSFPVLYRTQKHKVL